MKISPCIDSVIENQLLMHSWCMVKCKVQQTWVSVVKLLAYMPLRFWEMSMYQITNSDLEMKLNIEIYKDSNHNLCQFVRTPKQTFWAATEKKLLAFHCGIICPPPQSLKPQQPSPILMIKLSIPLTLSGLRFQTIFSCITWDYCYQGNYHEQIKENGIQAQTSFIQRQMISLCLTPKRNQHRRQPKESISVVCLCDRVNNNSKAASPDAWVFCQAARSIC